VAVVGGLEEAAEAFVADHGFVAPLQSLVQSGKGRSPGGGIVARFGLVVADDVAATARVALACLDLANNLLDLKVEGAAAIRLGNRHRDERGGVGQHGGDLDAALFAHAENILDPVGFEHGDGLGANHAAIGNNADAIEQETFPQPGDHRYQRRYVGGIARPHLAANRPSVLVDDDADHHLMQIGPGVFGMTVAPERLAAFALEIQAGGIEDRQPHIVEEAAALAEQLFLDQILVGAGSYAAAGLVREFWR